MDCTAAGGNECMNVLFQKRKKKTSLYKFTHVARMKKKEQPQQ